MAHGLNGICLRDRHNSRGYRHLMPVPAARVSDYQSSKSHGISRLLGGNTFRSGLHDLSLAIRTALRSSSQCHGHMGSEPNFEALRLRLSTLRADRGWTYEQLAERSGVSRATLIAMETGTPRGRRPDRPASRGSLESWWRLAGAFGVPLADLIGYLDDE